MIGAYRMRRLILVLVASLAASFASAEVKPAPPPQMPPPVVSDPGPEGSRVATGKVFANYFPAKGAGLHPAVLVLGGSEGGLGVAALRDAKALQAEGFAVLQLCYFGCPGTPEHLFDVPLETFSEGLAWLRAQPGVDPDRIGIEGGSKGSEAALLAATRDRRLKAVVVTMPSSVSWPGITYSAEMKPSWTEGGKPLPYLPYAFAQAPKSVFDIYNMALPTLPQHADGVIPVERIGGPIMLVCGEADNLWPSCPMSDLIAERLKAKGRPAPIILRYANAGHGVFGVPVDQPSPKIASLGGTVGGNVAARADSWPKSVAFLKAHLGL